MLLARILLKKRQLLHKCRDAYESRNQVILIGFCNYFIMNIAFSGPSIKDLGSESSSLF